jgi:hypothetical protein
MYSIKSFTFSLLGNLFYFLIIESWDSFRPVRVCWDIPIKRGFKATVLFFPSKLFCFYFILLPSVPNMGHNLNTSIIGPVHSLRG